MRIYWKKLRAAINGTAKDIKGLKKLQRESLQPRWDVSKQYLLYHLKWEATRLCSIAAHSRNRIHKPGSTLEEQAKFIGDGALAFALDTPIDTPKAVA